MNLIAAMDIIRRSIQLYKENKDLFAGYLKLLFIPSAIGIVIAALIEGFGASLSLMAKLGAQMSIAFMLGFVSLWMSIAFMRTIADRYNGITGRGPKETLREATPLLWPVIVVSILTSLAVLGGLILLVIPGIIFSVWFAFTMHAVVLDGKRWVGALSASKLLVQGRWWATLVRILVPGLIFGALFLVATGLIGAIGELLLKQMASQMWTALFIEIIFGLLSTALAILLTPLPTAAQIILFLELKKTPLLAKNAPPSPLPPTAV